MKTAEEVADYIADEIFCYDDEDLQILKELTARALTAYAEEQIQEVMDGKNKLYQWNYDKGVEAGKATFLGRIELARAEALEEAAKVLDEHACQHVSLILALKDKP